MLSITILGQSALIVLSSVLGPIEQKPTEAWHGLDLNPFPQAAPESVGLSADALDKAAAIAEEGGSESLLVARDGKIVYEKYWGGKTRADVQQMYSATKSPFAFVVGRAIERGYIKGLDQPLVELVPEIAGKGREQLTFRNILAMESGLEQSREMDAQDAKRGLSQFEVVMERGVSHEPFEK
ncbi:MAG: serine hydrolase, partial [Candidatus Hydrogenedentota bacterium]